MKTFNEFIDRKEFELLQYAIDEGFWNTLGGAVDAGISGLGTAGKQLARGAWNTGIGLGRTGLGAAGTMFGGDSKGGLRQLGQGLAQTGKGLFQTATAPIAGAVRGYEAGQNPFGDMKAGGVLGQTMGLRRAATPEEQRQQQARQQLQAKQNARQQAIVSNPDLLKKALFQSVNNKQLDLARQYRDMLKQYHPQFYNAMISNIKAKQANKQAALQPYQQMASMAS